MSHGALVIKNMGDGVFFYFPTKKSIQETAYGAIQSAQSLIALEQDINHSLKACNLPEISYRISMSYGPVSAMIDPAGHIIDLFGATINTFSKMNKMANPGTVVVGESLHTIVADMYASNSIGTYTINDTLSFPVFEIRQSLKK